MKTFNDDFTGKEHPTEHTVTVDISFRNPADSKFYKATLDISPQSAIEMIISKCIRKPFPFQEWHRYTEEEQKASNSKRVGKFTPAPNAKQILASLIETEVSQ